MIEFLLANNEETYEAAAHLFREYARDINIDLSFQHFEEELKELKTMYGEPLGAIILCRQDVRYVACVAIRKSADEICELKRMYVQPGFRGKGVGKNLLDYAIEFAKQIGYKKMRLDTLNYMKPAIKLYEENGFVKTEAYYFNPNETAVFFEKNFVTL